MKRLLLNKPISPWYVFVFAILFYAISVTAAPVHGPSGRAFYSPPSPLPSGDHGDLIWYREVNSAPTGAPMTRTWNVLYHSVGGDGETNCVSGTVMIPNEKWDGDGIRPIITYAPGTHGLCLDCVPSVQLEEGTEYESANLVALLEAGYAVLITDYAGYGTNAHTYMVGVSQGHAVLDIVEASMQIPDIDLDNNAPVGIWGYSQGGQSAAWAGELQPSYMPGLNLIGVSAGGIPADLIEVGYNVDGLTGSSFLLQVVMGMDSQFPDAFDLYNLANQTGVDAMAAASEACVFASLFDLMYVSLSDLVIGNPSLDEIIDMHIYDELEAQKLGNNRIEAPVYIYHGTADEFIPLAPALELKEKYCALGVEITFGVYPGEHITTQFQAAPFVLEWFENISKGNDAPNTCSTSAPEPSANNNPLDGDFIVTLDEWNLDAWVKLKTLGQKVYLSETSTFSADANMTRKNITGSLTIPKFIAPVWVTILPLQIRMSIEPVKNMDGYVSLDDKGMLHIHGTAYNTIKIQGLGVTRLALMPFFLETSDIVEFPIDFDGPISSLGDGNLTFNGETTFPSMKGAGIFSPLFTALISGPGQTYSITVSPPVPTTW